MSLTENMEGEKMVNKFDALGTIWIIAGFLGMIGLAFVYHYNEKVWTWEVITILIFTAMAFVLALHFTMHDFAKEVKKKDE